MNIREGRVEQLARATTVEIRVHEFGSLAGDLWSAFVLLHPRLEFPIRTIGGFCKANTKPTTQSFEPMELLEYGAPLLLVLGEKFLALGLESGRREQHFSLLAIPNVISPDARWLVEALQYYRTKSSDFGDALLCAYAHEEGWDVATFDKGILKKFPEVLAYTPIDWLARRTEQKDKGQN